MNHDNDSRRGADHITLALNKSVDVHTLDDHHGIKTQLVTVVAGRLRVTTRYFSPGLYHDRDLYSYTMDIDTSTGLPPRVSTPV